MSSTDAAAVFDHDVVAAAEVRRHGTGAPLPLAPEPHAGTYLISRTRRTLRRADFEWPAVASPAELRERLAQLWAGDPARLQLIEPLLRLARVPEADAGPAADVPDHVYPMY